MVGDEAELYRALAVRLERIVRAQVRAPREVIEDACHHAWTKRLNNSETVQRDTALAWLVRTAVHQAWKLDRREQREASLELAGELSSRLPGPQARVELRERLAALGGLPEPQRRLVWLRAAGLSHLEMAAYTGQTGAHCPTSALPRDRAHASAARRARPDTAGAGRPRARDGDPRARTRARTPGARDRAMTVLESADLRGFYKALGIELPAWAGHDAPVRCFASPEAHAHGDRNPSASVSLINGAWCCHGCGARGGAYDAALAVGHTPRSAIELMIAHGLIEPRTAPHAPRALRPVPTAARVAVSRSSKPELAVSDADVHRWQAALAHRPALLSRLAIERGWRYGAICELEIGLDPDGRLTIPIRDGRENLQGVLATSRGARTGRRCSPSAGPGSA